jgi:hypothetical protein
VSGSSETKGGSKFKVPAMLAMLVSADLASKSGSSKAASVERCRDKDADTAVSGRSALEAVLDSRGRAASNRGVGVSSDLRSSCLGLRRDGGRDGGRDRELLSELEGGEKAAAACEYMYSDIVVGCTPSLLLARYFSSVVASKVGIGRRLPTLLT